MENIYKILPKYFAGEASKEEKKEIGTFKDNNLSDYQLLEEFWHLQSFFITREILRQVNFKYLNN